MSDITPEQFQELTAAINCRLSEFGQSVFDPLTPGLVRLILSAMEEWNEADAIAANDQFADGYGVGYESGYEAAKRELYQPATTGPGNAPDPPHGFYAGAPENGMAEATQNVASSLGVALLKRSHEQGNPISIPSLGVVIEPPAPLPRLSPEAMTPLVPRRPKVDGGDERGQDS